MKRFDLFKNEWTIALLAAIAWIPFLGQVHLFDWDEINFAENAREMIATGDYFSVQMNYIRFTEKPPLFFWLQALSMHLFGINEAAARLPNAIAGIITVVALFRIGKKWGGISLARTWVLVYMGTFFTFLYPRSGIIDPWFNLFIFGAVYHFYLLSIQPEQNRRLSALTGLLLGLAILTKGPVALLLCLLTYGVMVIIRKGDFLISFSSFLLITATCFITCFAWFGVDLLQHGPRFMLEFIDRQIALFSTSDADHGEPFFYHWWVLLLGCFPASVFFIRGLVLTTENKSLRLLQTWMISLFWVTLIVFSIVTTKIIHYSSLCWLPLTFIAARYIDSLLLNVQTKIPRWVKFLVGIIGIGMGTLLAAIPFIMQRVNQWKDKVADPFARGNLEAAVDWYQWQSFAGILIIIATLYFILNSSIKRTIPFLFISVSFATLFLVVFIFPSVEAISQRANIEFFSSHQNEDCYQETLGYKSYAPYFYGRVKPPDNEQRQLLQAARNNGSTQPDTLTTAEKETNYKNWLISGSINKPVYFSVKIMDKQIYDTVPDFQFIGMKNGFVFYKRAAVAPKNN
jgi:4-amino-4-deoxy-L-arabinose transferase-like glycosyltransferase